MFEEDANVEPAPELPIDRESETLKSKSKKVYTDPLLWFGTLVPPVLRTAQSEFKFAVMEQVTQLATITRKMEDVEIEIRRLRKWIGKGKVGKLAADLTIE